MGSIPPCMRGGTKCAWCRKGSKRYILYKGEYVPSNKKLECLRNKTVKALEDYVSADMNLKRIRQNGGDLEKVEKAFVEARNKHILANEKYEAAINAAKADLKRMQLRNPRTGKSMFRLRGNPR